MGGDGVQLVDNLGVSVLQRLGLLHIVVGGVEWEDVDEEADDARALLLLDERGVAIHNLGEIERVRLGVVGGYNLIFAQVFVLGYL